MTDTLDAVLDDVLQSQKERARRTRAAYLRHLVNEIAAGRQSRRPSGRKACLRQPRRRPEHLRADVMLRKQRMRGETRHRRRRVSFNPALDAIVAGHPKTHRKSAAARRSTKRQAAAWLRNTRF